MSGPFSMLLLMLIVVLQLEHQVLGYSFSDQYFSGEGKKFGKEKVAFAVSGPKGDEGTPFMYPKQHNIL
ncbi:unnamed protein product [Notodromas monacha]|uniref:Uncharacterized protein n=1 Tax=Notodromas monacha TaxID=399045 RepID=A0A7R9BQ01_9CRUS|nr:unnamed protein product [Notodromas monacha]CAG0919515.1 unnamed protein product [Notodromas monacha]